MIPPCSSTEESSGTTFCMKGCCQIESRTAAAPEASSIVGPSPLEGPATGSTTRAIGGGVPRPAGTGGPTCGRGKGRIAGTGVGVGDEGGGVESMVKFKLTETPLVQLSK